MSALHHITMCLSWCKDEKYRHFRTYNVIMLTRKSETNVFKVQQGQVYQYSSRPDSFDFISEFWRQSVVNQLCTGIAWSRVPSRLKSWIFQDKIAFITTRIIASLDFTSSVQYMINFVSIGNARWFTEGCTGAGGSSGTVYEPKK